MAKFNFSFAPLGESALILKLGDEISLMLSREVNAWHRVLLANPFQGFYAAVAAYSSLTIHFNPLEISGEEVQSYLGSLAVKVSTEEEGFTPNDYEVEVAYGGEEGPDLGLVARQLGLTEKEVVREHSQGIYEVAFLGYLPGFPYLVGLPGGLNVPRHFNPRPQVSPGSVAIAAGQAGIYPSFAPGGWSLLGRSCFPLLTKDGRAVLKAGDRIKFQPRRA